MGRKCCIPGCRSNYSSEPGYVTVFTITRERKDLWKKFIPRTNWDPSPNAVVCIKHFRDEDLSYIETYIDKNGQTREWKRERPLLKVDAVPRLFPSLPQYLEKRMPKKRTCRKEKREQHYARIKEEPDDLEYQKEEKDYISCQVDMEQFQLGASEEDSGNEEEVMEPLLAVFLQPEEIEDVSVEEEDPLAVDVKPRLVFEEDVDKYCHGPEEFVIIGKSDICNDSADEVGKAVLQESFAKNFNSKTKTFSSRVNYESRIHNFSEDVDKFIKQNKIVCAICKKRFSNRCEWNEHVQEHTAPKAYSCKICKRLYSEKDYVCDHIRESLETQNFEHLVCQEGFPLKAAFVKHVKRHVKKKPCVCKICNKCFTKKSLLQEHFRIHEKKLFECSICKKCFTYKSWLTRHMMFHEKYKCRECNESFSRKIVFERHVRQHKGKDNFECSICKKKFSSNRACSMHMRIHKLKRHKCNFCNKFFFGNVHMCCLMKPNAKQTVRKPQFSSNKHKELNSGKLYCSICDKKFSSKSGFYKHQKLHLMNPHRCRECKKCFSLYDKLILHIAAHHGSKPFACNTCPKNFSVKANLLRHMLTHTSDNPNECNTCHKCFPDNVSLLRHMLTHIRKRR